MIFWNLPKMLWRAITQPSRMVIDAAERRRAELLAGLTFFFSLKTEIGFDALPAEAPPAIRRLLRRCLERNPRNRLHDAADARIVIDEVLSGRANADEARHAGAAPAPARGSGWPARLVWLGTGIALGAIAIALVGRALFVEPPSLPPSVRSLTYSGTSGDASVSADGRTVAFVSDRDGTPRIWLKQLASGEEVALTQGKDFGPRISPDSSSVAFGRAVDEGVDIFRVPLVGGEPRRLARNVISADWSPIYTV